jgi:sulfate adenylyltransferase
MELLTRHRLGEGAGVQVSSAGTHGLEGEKMNRTMAFNLVDGIRHRSFTSRRLTQAMIDEADLVLTAEDSQRRFVLEEHPAAFRKVWTLGQFAEAVRRVPAEDGRRPTGRALVAVVSRVSGISQVRDDIPDPYRRGPDVNAACAARIDELLDVVLPALAP